MRIVSWNIENLAPWLDGRLAPFAREQLGDPDVLCLQEVRVRSRDAELVEQMRAALPGYACHAQLADDPRNASYRGGRAYGVATYVRGEAKQLLQPWDREGRICISQIGSLKIINIYAVNGTPKAYLDPETGAPSGDRHAFKRAFQDRVIALAGATNTVIAGDWNVSRTPLDVTPRLRTEEPHARARAELNAHFERTGLVDVWRAAHPDEKGYTWFDKRSYRLDAARVDYIVATPDLTATDAEILTDLRVGTDHAPVSVTIRPSRTTSRATRRRATR